MQQRATVMVVDDDPLNLELIAAMLENEGYEMLLMDSGKNCLDAVRTKTPDIILLDALMPQMSGFQVVKMLKSNEATQKIPVVMVTALSDVSDRVRALEVGVDDFLTKPVMKVEVLARIRSLVKMKRYDDRILESEKKFRNLVQDASVIIVSINDQGKIDFMNEYGLEFFECTLEELNANSNEGNSESGKAIYGRHLQQTICEVKNKAGDNNRTTTEHMTRSGRRVWVDWTSRSILDDKSGKASALCVGIDVTVSKRSQLEELRRYERRKVRDILSDAISGRISQNEFIGLTQQMGLALVPPFALSLLTIPEHTPSLSSQGADLIEWQFQIDYLVDSIRLSGMGIAAQVRNGVVVLQSINSGRSKSLSVNVAKQAANELIKASARYWPGKEIKIGLAQSSAEIQSIAELYEQAGCALKYGAIFDAGKVVYHWSDLGCFQFIVKDYHSAMARKFVQDHLGPIINDVRNGNLAEELASLEAIISGDSLQVIADRLHVHRQTMVFRKRKLEEKLGTDLDRLTSRMNLAFAMRIFYLQS